MRYRLLILFAIVTKALLADGPKPFTKTGDIFGVRNFVENKGQFDNVLKDGETVYFAYDNGDEKIYFTAKGLVYKMEKWPKVNHKRFEEIEHGKFDGLKPEHIYTVNMNWLESNPNIKIEASKRSEHYFTYGEAKYNSYGYKRVTYLNVYDGIDIEYVLPDEKEYGIKYTIIVHPGADPNLVKIAYSGDVKDIDLKNDQAIVATNLHTITEHAPETFYVSGGKIKARFKLKRKVLSFEMPEGYDNSKEIRIDPFVVSVVAPGNNYAYDVTYDNAGRVYIYGGHTPHKAVKYGTNGSMLWTFSGSISSLNWSWSYLVESMTVNKNNGKMYLGGMVTSSGSKVVRLDSSGNYDNFITSGGQMGEIWSMGFNPTNGDLIPFGGCCPLNLGVIDQATSNYSITFSTQGKLYDIACHTFDNAGNCFILQTSGPKGPPSTFPNAYSNTIARLNTTITDTVWKKLTTYWSFGEAVNKSAYFNVGWGLTMFNTLYTSNAFNALAVNNNYLFYWDGYNIAAYNKSNGQKIGFTTVNTLTVMEQGGIAVDDCDNIYIGGNGAILIYNFNGTSFNQLGTIPIASTSSVQYVYDVRLDNANNLILAAGSGFVGKYLNTYCSPNPPPTFQQICWGSVATVSISNPSNLSNPSYSIQPGSTVQSSPNFTVQPNSTTVYTLYITGTNSTSAVVTQTSIATVSVNSSPVLSPTVINASCTNTNASFANLNTTFSPNISTNYTVTWSPLPSSITVVNSSTAAGLLPGINTVTVTAANGCTATTSFSVPPTPLPASFVIVNPSNDYTITCINPNVVLTTSVVNGVPLNYTWFPSCTGSLTGSSMSFNQACTGQVIGTSSTGCQMTQTFTIYQDFTSPTIAITPSVQSISCSSGPGCFTLTSNLGPNVTTNWFQIMGSNTVYVGAAQGTINIFCAGAPGVYWGESVYNISGCRTTQSVQVTASVGVPQFTVTSPTNFTIGCGTKSVTSMQVTSVITSPVPNVAVNYTFMTPPVTSTPTTFTINPNLNFITVPGTYVIYVKDLTNNCVSSQSISIIQNTLAPNVNFIQPLPLLTCRDFSMVMTGISSNTNTQITWTVPAFPGSSVNPTPNATVVTMPSITGATNNVVAIGVWTVGAVDQNNFCSSSKTVQINQDIRVPKFTISALSNSIINCKNADVVIVPIITPSLASALVPTYIWYPPVGNAQPGTQYNTTAAGTHTSISTSVVNGCTYSATYDVASDLVPPSIGLAFPFILDCNTNPTVALTPTINGSTSGLTYTWTVPPGALTSNIHALNLTSNVVGLYFISITNTLNGCFSQAAFQVVEGSIKADFIAEPEMGYAPLNVTFTNTSGTSTGASSIISTWGYGNGATTATVYNTSQTSTTYTAPGTYSVILKVKKGTCIAEKIKIITVELPSKLEVPNVFTPNKDKVNDVFRLRASSLSEIYIIIFDRWGTKVYELNSDTGNFSWDGTDQSGKICADGTYFYIIKAQGLDGKEFEVKGNVSLFR